MERGVGYLLFGDAHVILNVGEDGGLDEEALCADTPPAALQFGALFLPGVDQREDPLELLVVDLRPLLDARLERVADLLRARQLNRLGDESLVDVLVDERP